MRRAPIEIGPIELSERTGRPCASYYFPATGILRTALRTEAGMDPLDTHRGAALLGADHGSQRPT
jgi:hypothetical protein